MTKKIAIYGKGGSGKTTIAANLSAALAESGFRVLLVGCSPTADSSHLLSGETAPRQLLACLIRAEKPDLSTIITSGYRGIGCIEVGEYPGGGHLYLPECRCRPQTAEEVGSGRKLRAGLRHLRYARGCGLCR